MLTSAKKVLPWLPVGLLLLAILAHGVAIERHDADPQRGSAFAMFASVDIRATRRVIATAEGEPTIALDVSGALQEASDRLRDAPSDDGASELAQRLVESTWELDGETASIGGVATFDEVRVQVVGLEADGRTISRQVFADVVASATGR